jgi:MoaA/NifB/PqqE/SkfB family radical SAM enzyme
MGILSTFRKIRGNLLSLMLAVTRHKILAPLPIFITDRCNSRCLICNIWKKKPIDLDVEIIKKILNDKVVTKFSSFIIAGGEPILHPRFKEIMPLFHGRNYLFLSNGLLADKLVEAVRKFKINRLSLSLDGTPETYKKVRGVDGYSKVEKVVQELKDDKVSVYIFFVVNPWNTRDDLIHVIDFSKKYGLYLLLGYYQNFPYFDTIQPANNLYEINDLLTGTPFPSNPHPYFKLYAQWASGNLNIPCLSVLLRPVIRANGDVELCEGRKSIIGNLYEQSLGEIWTSKKTRELQRQFIHCNACWADGQRTMDIVLSSILRSFLPSILLNKALGKYDWKKIPTIWSW